MVYHYDGRTDNMQQLQWNVKNVDLACCMYALALATNYITKDEMIIERVLQVYTHHPCSGKKLLYRARQTEKNLNSNVYVGQASREYGTSLWCTACLIGWLAGWMVAATRTRYTQTDATTRVVLLIFPGKLQPLLAATSQSRSAWPGHM